MACPSEEALALLSSGAQVDDSVRSHAEGCAECKAVLQALAAARSGVMSNTLASPGTARGSAAPPQQQIGRYEVHRLLGAGAMGRVFEAHDPQLDRRVALKMLLGAETSELRARLLREARAVAKVRHPNVVAVHDVGTVDEQIFIAMELVPGGSLRDFLRERHGWREVATVMRGAGRGLSAVHAAGLIHRDFKPDNVLLDQDGTARVSDFGLVGREDSAVEASPESADPNWELTRTGALLGTPAYMAPELLAGKPATAASDQFAFCVTLYEALEGRRPFHAATLSGLKNALLAGAPASSPEVPRWLAAIVRRGLSVDPTARFPSMDALLAELEAGLSPSRRPRLIAPALVLVTLALGGAFWWRESHLCSGGTARWAAVWSPQRATRLTAAATASGKAWAPAVWAQAQRELEAWGESFRGGYLDACEASRVRQEQSAEVMDARMRCLDERLREVDAWLTVMEHADEKALENSSRVAASLPPPASCANLAWVTARSGPPVEPAAAKTWARFQQALIEVKALRRAGRITDSSKALDALGAEVESAPASVRAPYSLERGEALFGAGKFDDARAEFWKAAQALPSSHDAELGFKVWRALAGVEVTTRKLDEAQRFAELARGQLEALGKPAELEADLEKVLGIIDSNAGRTELAIGHFARSLTLNASLPGDHRVPLAEDELNLSSEYIRLKKFADAMTHVEKAIELDEGLYGKDHLVVAGPLNNLSIVLRQLGKKQEALEVSRRVVAIREKYLPPDHVDLSKAWNNLGRALDELDDLPAAMDAYVKARDIRIASMGQNVPEVAMQRSNIAGLLEKMGKLDEADQEYSAALSALEGAKDPTLPAQVALGQGMLRLGRGNAAGALECFQRSLALYQASLPKDHSTLCWTWACVARAQLALRQPKEALGPAGSAIACYESREKPTAEDEQELEVSRFAKGRALLEASIDRPRGEALVFGAYRWAVENEDAVTTQEITAWAKTASLKLPRVTPPPPQ